MISTFSTPAEGLRAADLELLRRFEPVVRYTRGEEFLPVRVDSYVEACSLWVHHADGVDEQLVERGGLTIDELGQPRVAEFGAVHFLKFIEPLTVAEFAGLLLNARGGQLREPENEFRTDLSRLARVGYGSRILDALFSLTLLLRGRVPGDTAAASVLAGRAIRASEPTYPYYGRVVRQNGWIALQYWFFYHFNDWRSGFYGANDHEADWEMITIFAYEEDDGSIAPRWVAYANHDFHGDDLRRRWDDFEEVERIGEHPVVYAGAGSHAAYFRRGEYLTEVEIVALRPLIRAVQLVRTFWTHALRQSGSDAQPMLNVFRIPFVDYARGDGPTVGPGQRCEWTPVHLDPVPPWVAEYHGLWGVDVRDPLGGENAPSGPMYNRDGSIRQSWYDPAGWAGLDKVPNPATERATLQRRRDTLLDCQEALDAEIASKGRQMQELGAELMALRGHPHLRGRHDAIQEQAAALAAEVRLARKEHAHNEGLLDAISRRIAAVDAHEPDDPRAHIRRLATPASEARLRLTRVVEGWAAISIGVLLIGLVGLIALAPQFLLPGALIMVGGFVLVEAIFRRRLANLIATVTIGLTIVSAFVLLYDFFWHTIIAVVVLAALYLTVENVRELRG